MSELWEVLGHIFNSFRHILAAIWVFFLYCLVGLGLMFIKGLLTVKNDYKGRYGGDEDED